MLVVVVRWSYKLRALRLFWRECCTTTMKLNILLLLQLIWLKWLHFALSAAIFGCCKNVQAYFQLAQVHRLLGVSSSLLSTVFGNWLRSLFHGDTWSTVVPTRPTMYPLTMDMNVNGAGNKVLLQVLPLSYNMVSRLHKAVAFDASLVTQRMHLCCNRCSSDISKHNKRTGSVQ